MKSSSEPSRQTMPDSAIALAMIGASGARYGVRLLETSPGHMAIGTEDWSAPDLVDFVVDRVLEHLNIAHALVPRWGARADE
jgi:3-polyprenyl-4-hydroxybenzoate decarboxylase